MKNKIIIAALALGFTTISCDPKKGETKLEEEINKVDSKIADGINNLKDTLKIENDTVYIETSQFKTVTLRKEFTDLNGKSISFEKIIDANKGKTIIIDVWATWCPDCIKGFKSLKKVQKQYPNAAYVFLSLDKNQDDWKKGIEKYDLKGTHYFLNEKMSGEFGKSIDLDWIPRYIIIDKEGQIANYKSIVADDKTFLHTIKKLEQ